MRRIDRRLVLLSFVLVCDVVSVFGRPQEHSTAGSQSKADNDDGRVDNRNADAQATPIFVFAETTGNNDAGDGRAHTTKSPPPPPPPPPPSSMMGDSVRTVSDQLLQSSTSTSNVIVSSELRTVPSKNESPLSSPLQGEAVPVLMDEDVHAVGPYSYKISSDGSTKPTGGDLSTWILLGGGGGGESSPAPLNMATIRKVPKPADATASSFIAQQSYEVTTSSSSSSSSSTAMVTRKRKPSTTTTTTEKTAGHPYRSPAVTESPIKLQDSKFKNKTPVVVGKIPTNFTATTATSAVKVDEPATSPMPELLPPVDNNTRFGTPVVTFPHVPPRQRPSANNTKKTEKPEKPLTTKITSTAVVISKPAGANHTSTATTTTTTTTVSPTVVPTTAAPPTAVTVNNSTEMAPSSVTDSSSINSSTVKNNTSLKKKKKKKNKNKRRPVKTSNDENAQSKIDDQNAKLPSGRPLSTRIYNYLAREVMPNVGVGLVGLMLTAGLAGLLLYSPLGGAAIPMVPLRRNDPHVGHGHGHGSSGGYVPPPEADNSQPEEQVFGQVLSGMSYGHNPYGRERPADPVVPKFKPSYQTAEYPAVHDVPKYTGGAHDTAAKYSAHDTTKYSAADTTKYSTTHDGTKYAVVESTKYSAPDTSNTYSAPDTASKYSTIDETVSAASQDGGVSSSYPSLQQQQQQDVSQGAASAAYDQQTALQQDSDDDQTYQNHHYDQIKFDSSNAYEQPKYTSNAGNAYRDDQSFDALKYPGYVQDVPKEDAVIYNFENHRTTDDKDGSTASPSSDPSFSALQGVPKFYDPSADPEQISVNVHQTMKMEHGPRNLRIRRQVDEHNEIDAQLPVEETTTVRQATEETTSDKATESQTDGESTFSTTSATSSTTVPITTTTPTTTTSSEKPTAPHSNQFSLVDLLRRVAEVKLKMGIEILRNTAASFTQYVNAIQRRMTHMVRNLQKSNDRAQPDVKQEQNAKITESTVTNEKRQRRSTRHRMYSN